MAGFGSTGALVGAAVCAFVIAGAVLGFKGWPSLDLPGGARSLRVDDTTLSGPQQAAFDAVAAAGAVAAVPTGPAVTPVQGAAPVGGPLARRISPPGPGTPGGPAQGFIATPPASPQTGGGNGGDPRPGDGTRALTGAAGGAARGTTRTLGDALGAVSPTLGQAVGDTGAAVGGAVTGAGATLGDAIDGLAGR